MLKKLLVLIIILFTLGCTNIINVESPPTFIIQEDSFASSSLSNICNLIPLLNSSNSNNLRKAASNGLMVITNPGIEVYVIDWNVITPNNIAPGTIAKCKIKNMDTIIYCISKDIKSK